MTTINSSAKDRMCGRSICCIVLPTITKNLPIHTFDKRLIIIPPNVEGQLADKKCNEKLDILLGVDLFYDVLLPDQFRTDRKQPFFQETKLGWLITGFRQNVKISSFMTVSNTAITTENLDSQLKRFGKNF